MINPGTWYLQYIYMLTKSNDTDSKIRTDKKIDRKGKKKKKKENSNTGINDTTTLKINLTEQRPGFQDKCI